MKPLSLLVALGVSMTPSLALCKTEVVNSMQAVQTIFEKSTGETLGLFDIDAVLIQSSIPAFQMANLKQHKTVLKALLEPLTPLEKDMTLMLTLTHGHTLLVEPQTPSIITNIRKNTPKLIALTSTLTGPWNNITDPILFRAEQLKSVGIDFSDSFSTLQGMIFNNMKPYRNHYPEFKQGILAANGAQKGAALIEFLKRTDYKPNAIIFIDDRENNIKDVEKALSTAHPTIQFTGILYAGALDFPSQPIDEASFKHAWSENIERAKEILQPLGVQN